MFRKKLALLAAVVISAGMISSIPSEVYAVTSNTSASSSASNTDKQDEKEQMQKALALFKSRIAIPQEYSEFTYSTSERYSMPSFRFKWKNKDKNNAYCTATVTGGIITEFSKPYTYINYAVFSPYSAEELKNKALAWINKVNPETKGHLAINSEPDLALKNNRIYMQFVRTDGDVKLSKNTVDIYIDKMTGEVVSYSCNWWQNAQFPDASKAIGQEAIQAIYRNEIGIKPWYRLKYDYKTKKYTAKLVYVPLDSYVYNALTGEHTTMQDDYIAAINTDNYAEDDIDDTEGGAGIDEDGGVIFTDEELSALQEQKNLLTVDEFRKLMYNDPYIELTSKYMTESYSISANENFESGYSINASFVINNSKEYKHYNITADAKTGKVSSFNFATDGSSKVLNVKEANNLAEAAAKYYYGDIFGHYKADPENTAPAVKSKNYTESSRSIRYYRYENNIQVEGNSIRINVNSAGQIIGISSSYTKGVDFGDGKILSQEAVMNKLFEQKEFNLYYDGFTDLKSKPHTYLHYNLDRWTVNAKTGQLCDYYGDPLTDYKDIPTLCPYTDIESSPYKDEIITLYNHGVRVFTDDTLQPKKALTFEEAERLFSRLGNTGILITEEQAKKPITRLDLAKQLVTMMGYSKSTELKGIYKSPYKDVSENDKDIAYIAINYALGIMPDDGNGNFNGSGYISREYAMHCMYEYIVKTSAENAKNQSNQTVSSVYYDDYDVIEDIIYEEVDYGDPID